MTKIKKPKANDIFEQIRFEINKQMLDDDVCTDLGIYENREIDEISPAELGFMRAQLAG